MTVRHAIRQFAAEVAQCTDRVEVLVNNGARWLEGPDLLSASDEDVTDTIAAGATGTVLMVKRFLPLLLASDRPDVVNMVSAPGLPAHQRSNAHDAFYAAKCAQAGFADILSKRLRPQGVRVISLYPPDFCNPDPLSPQWESTPRGSGDMLTAHSVAECVFFALRQPRGCFISRSTSSRRLTGRENIDKGGRAVTFGPIARATPGPVQPAVLTQHLRMPLIPDLLADA